MENAIFFQDEAAALRWLSEDEYSPLEALAEQGEVPPNLAPPHQGIWG